MLRAGNSNAGVFASTFYNPVYTKIPAHTSARYKRVKMYFGRSTERYSAIVI